MLQNRGEDRFDEMEPKLIHKIVNDHFFHIFKVFIDEIQLNFNGTEASSFDDQWAKQFIKKIDDRANSLLSVENIDKFNNYNDLFYKIF